MKAFSAKNDLGLPILTSTILEANEHLDQLKWLYLHMPVLSNCNAEDLRKVYGQYIPILADFTSINESYRVATSDLRDKADDIDMLISANFNEKTIKEKELFLSGAHSFLKADIRSLIVIIEIFKKRGNN